MMTELREQATSIVSRLRTEGHETYFAGGCVRDRLLNQTPKDYDIATSATPEEVMRLYPDSDSVGAHFGVILVRLSGAHFEVATFREDGEYSDGRRPDQVVFSNAQQDAQRRDFTINGLFEDPITGEIIDFVGGLDDLKSHCLRAIGNPAQRFQEDALRLMRAIRFSLKTGFTIENSTWSAITQHSSLLSDISIERITQEFSAILMHPQRRQGVEKLVKSGLIREFLPEILDLIGCEQPPEHHPEGDVYTHTCIALEHLPPDPPLSLCFAMLLHDIAKPATFAYDAEKKKISFHGHEHLGAQMAESILRRLKVSNQLRETVVTMVSRHMQFMNVTKMRTATLKRFMASEHFEQEIALHQADCLSSNGQLENFEFIRAQYESYEDQPVLPQPLLTGADLIQHHLSPGPLFRQILTEAQTEQLENRLTTREEALAWLTQKLTS